MFLVMSPGDENTLGVGDIHISAKEICIASRIAEVYSHRSRDSSTIVLSPTLSFLYTLLLSVTFDERKYK